MSATFGSQLFRSSRLQRTAENQAAIAASELGGERLLWAVLIGARQPYRQDAAVAPMAAESPN